MGVPMVSGGELIRDAKPGQAVRRLITAAQRGGSFMMSSDERVSSSGLPLDR
jgi:hypothetical protein